jgi:hypothetical protein
VKKAARCRGFEEAYAGRFADLTHEGKNASLHPALGGAARRIEHRVP